MKRANGLRTIQDLADATDVTRKTWSKALRDREPQSTVLQELAKLGARHNRILVSADDTLLSAAA
ncbi:XRE family transcriptional regulator [Corynebacterium sp.]|uniref:XRE family transcriptional regulator n=1 Tax=Corynebacterium sp. TaxID=1720 RepID=UPI003B3B1EB3